MYGTPTERDIDKRITDLEETLADAWDTIENMLNVIELLVENVKRNGN